MSFIIIKFIGFLIIVGISNAITAANFYKLGKQDAIAELNKESK